MLKQLAVAMAVLLELIETKVNYVVQEAIVVLKDIFRKYPNRCVLAPLFVACCCMFLRCCRGLLRDS